MNKNVEIQKFINLWCLLIIWSYESFNVITRLRQGGICYSVVQVPSGVSRLRAILKVKRETPRYCVCNTMYIPAVKCPYIIYQFYLLLFEDRAHVNSACVKDVLSKLNVQFNVYFWNMKGGKFYNYFKCLQNI